VRRAHGHLAFGIAALGFGLVTAARFVRLEHAYEVNTAIARATESDSASVLSFAVDPAEGAGAQAGSGDRAGAEAGADDGAGVKANPVAIESLPEARLARAVALSKVD
jgi:uncharacterized spore protein YtfJ